LEKRGYRRAYGFNKVRRKTVVKKGAPVQLDMMALGVWK